jgi:hypothetical protein
VCFLEWSKERKKGVELFPHKCQWNNTHIREKDFQREE